jgi:hypothetical protein
VEVGSATYNGKDVGAFVDVARDASGLGLEDGKLDEDVEGRNRAEVGAQDACWRDNIRGEVAFFSRFHYTITKSVRNAMQSVYSNGTDGAST